MKLLTATLALTGMATAYLWKQEQNIPTQANDLPLIASTVAGLAINVFGANTLSYGALGAASLNVALGGAAAYLAVQSIEYTFESTFKDQKIRNPLVDSGMRVLNFFHLTATSTSCFFRAVQIVLIKTI